MPDTGSAKQSGSMVEKAEFVAAQQGVPVEAAAGLLKVKGRLARAAAFRSAMKKFRDLSEKG